MKECTFKPNISMINSLS